MVRPTERESERRTARDDHRCVADNGAAAVGRGRRERAAVTHMVGQRGEGGTSVIKIQHLT